MPKMEQKFFEDYSHIQLTETEVQAALYRARMMKARKLEEQEAEQQRLQAIEQMKKPWTKDQLLFELRERAKRLPFRFSVDDNNRKVFDLLLLYFTGDPAFEQQTYIGHDGQEHNYTFRKGLMLSSPVRGTGKTVLMELFSRTPGRSYVVVPTKRITSFFEADGDAVITRFSQPWRCEPTPEFFYQSPIGICFDDLGDEEIKNHFGNRENVMARVISRIYDEATDKAVFKYFHCTTNLTGNELQQKYDSRVRSRMREMFNFIELPGHDRRI
jgi:hypothetical protein